MVDVWFYPARVISKNLISYYQNAMTMGQIDVAMVALQTTWTYMILGGEKLQLISQHIDKNLRLVVSVWYDVLSKVLYCDDLTMLFELSHDFKVEAQCSIYKVLLSRHCSLIRTKRKVG